MLLLQPSTVHVLQTVLSWLPPNKESLEKSIGAESDLFLPLSMNVKEEADVKKAIAQATEKFGRIDVVVNNAGFTHQERDKMTELLGSGLTDSFRHLYPDRRDAYSWWSYMSNARERNIGWRIDYFLVSSQIDRQIREAAILPEVLGSDHCPVVLEVF